MNFANETEKKVADQIENNVNGINIQMTKKVGTKDVYCIIRRK